MQSKRKNAINVNAGLIILCCLCPKKMLSNPVSNEIIHIFTANNLY